MSKVREGVAAEKPCVRYMVTGEDTISAQTADDRSLRKTKMFRRSLLKPPRKIVATVRDENEVAQEEEGEWSGIVRRLFAIMLAIFSRNVFGIPRSTRSGHLLLH